MAEAMVARRLCAHAREGPGMAFIIELEAVGGRFLRSKVRGRGMGRGKVKVRRRHHRPGGVGRSERPSRAREARGARGEGRKVGSA
jgi:hypothetical protein